MKLYSPAPDLGDVMVYDISGRLVMKKNVFMAQGFLSYTFEVDIPASGIYVVRALGNHLELKQNIRIVK